MATVLDDIKNSHHITFINKTLTEENLAKIAAEQFDIASSISLKTPIEWVYDETTNTFSKLKKEVDLETLTRENFDKLDVEALQVIKEIPIYSFMYRSESNLYTERVRPNIGVLIENQKIVNIEDNNALCGNINDTYTYTDKQKSLINTYADLLLDNSKYTQNINSSVGLLLKAAQETQTRLLDIERSIGGVDFTTRPGAFENLNIENTNLNQNPTTLGLNRLIKALSQEVFEIYDPQLDPNGSGDFQELSITKLSRMDRLDKQINGDEVLNADNSLNVDVYTNNIDGLLERGDSTPKTYITLDENNTEIDRREISKITDDKLISEGKFTSLYDAINRISDKVNRITEDVYDVDNVVKSPRRLETLRDNIETLLRDNFGNEITYVDISNNSNPYTKVELGEGSGLYSKLDVITNLLYNVSLPFSYNTISSNAIFNGKNTNRICALENVSNNNILYSTPTNTTLLDFFENANIIDYITDAIGKEYLVRFNASGVNKPGEDILLNDREWLRYQNSLGDRIRILEESLDAAAELLIGGANCKFENLKDYTNTYFTKENETSYKFLSTNDEIKTSATPNSTFKFMNECLSLKAFCEFVVSWFGFKVNNGSYELDTPITSANDIENSLNNHTHTQQIIKWLYDSVKQHTSDISKITSTLTNAFGESDNSFVNLLNANFENPINSLTCSVKGTQQVHFGNTLNWNYNKKTIDTNVDATTGVTSFSVSTSNEEAKANALMKGLHNLQASLSAIIGVDLTSPLLEEVLNNGWTGEGENQVKMLPTQVPSYWTSNEFSIYARLNALKTQMPDISDFVSSDTGSLIN